jgi:hypothetical protein
MRRSSQLIFALVVLNWLLASPVSAEQVTIFGTGLDAAGNPLEYGSVDANYVLLSGPGITGPAPAYVNGWGGSGGWWGAGNTATSQWIGEAGLGCQGCGGYSPVGDYFYQTAFSLAGFDLSTVVLTGQWATDNEGAIYLNGVSTGITLVGDTFSSFTPLTINSGFQPGLNTLVFYVHNDGGPTGLQVQISGTGSQVPEPSTLVLLGSGLVALAGAARRKFRR